MKKLFDKIKGAKNAMRCYREGVELLAAQNTDVKVFDDKFLIESKDLVRSFPFVARAIKKRQTKLIFLEPQKAEVFAGMHSDYIDREYCEKNGIRITPFPTQGGAAVCNKGDILLICIHPMKSGFKFLEFIKPEIIGWLTKAGIENITAQGNDIEVNGKKLSGSSISYRMGMVIEGIFINGSGNHNHLDAIGHKGKKREVTSLIDLGINLKDFRKWLVETTEEAGESLKG